MTAARQGARAPWLWAALVAPLWLALILCARWEPVVRDGWSNVYWHRWNDVTLANVWSLVESGWREANPRLGQLVTTLLYAPGPYHAMITPLLELGLFVVMTTLVLGRWPSVRRADDALAFVTVTAMVAACTPQFGPMLFYRPFTGNYTFGLLLNLLWLVPYRLEVEAPRARRGWLTPLMLVLGFSAGMCNEHTGPAFLGMGVLAIAWTWRRGPGVRAWMVAGLLGLIAGYLVLMLAPGHALRYAGLATQLGPVERIVERGLGGNLRVFGMLALYLAWALPWAALGLWARRAHPGQLAPAARVSLLVLAGAGVLSTLVLLASPKLGPRLYLATIVLIAIAVTGWLYAQLDSRWARRACGGLSAVALAYVLVRCVATYAAVGPVGAERLTLVQTSPHGTVLRLPRYPIEAGKWFLGEDLVVDGLREALAADYGLGRIELAP